ncbi:hypothetical protein [uncultured Demequina sp.]|uniref:hypothetical protein n=1 Tax=uncultured Demequina sp. TaxID=693499 RepID=UPI0025F6A712|nr:hypothetical protein [uncultured Demequina sp.]
MSDQDTSVRRRKRVRLILAGVAVAGIGAAVTTAAWTDDVWFSADVSGAEFDLQGGLVSGGPYEDVGDAATDLLEGDPSDDVVIQIPAGTFEDLVPDADETVTLYLYNDGTTDIDLSSPLATPTGAIFGGATPPTVTVGALGATTLAPGDETSFDVQITTPDDWPVDYIGLTGGVTVVVVGTAS